MRVLAVALRNSFKPAHMSLSVELVLTAVEGYDYAKVKALTFQGEGLEVKLELPQRILEEVNWSPSPGDRVVAELSGKIGNLEEWDIVLSGTLLKREAEYAAYSFGGLLCLIKGSSVEAPKKAYFALRVKR